MCGWIKDRQDAEVWMNIKNKFFCDIIPLHYWFMWHLQFRPIKHAWQNSVWNTFCWGYFILFFLLSNPEVFLSQVQSWKHLSGPEVLKPLTATGICMLLKYFILNLIIHTSGEENKVRLIRWKWCRAVFTNQHSFKVGDLGTFSVGCSTVSPWAVRELPCTKCLDV